MVSLNLAHPVYRWCKPGGCWDWKLFLFCTNTVFSWPYMVALMLH